MPSKPKPPRTYIVANPRGLPAGKWIVKVDGRLYFEGDAFEGVPSARFIEQGYVETSEQRDARLAKAAEAEAERLAAEGAERIAKAQRVAEQQAEERRLARELAARERDNASDVAKRKRQREEEVAGG